MLRISLERSLIVSVVLLLAVWLGCSKDPAGPPPTGAGKVVEISGNVTARQGHDLRVLKTGETVAGDDMIETGVDSSIVIVLNHNQARWELGPSSRKRVDASVAWGLPLNAKPGQATEQDSAAAGRPAEKTAAETTVSAPVTTDLRRHDEQRKPEPRPTNEQSKNTVRDIPESGFKDPTPITPKPPETTTPAPDTRDTRDTRDTTRDTPRDTSPSTGPAPIRPSTVFLEHEKSLAKCLTAGVPNVSIRVRITKHKPSYTVTSKSKVTAEVKSCLIDILDTASRDSRLEADVDVTLQITR